MAKFDGILICTDLDGTLMKKDKTISKENVEAIEYFKSEGGYFTFVTGRMPYFARTTWEAITPNVPFVCINGGAIYDHKKEDYLWLNTLQKEALELVEYAMQKVDGIGVQVNTPDKIYFCTENSAQERFRRVTGAPNLVSGLREIEEDIAKILLVDDREEAIQSLISVLPQHKLSKKFDFIRSERTLYEILPKGVNKGTGLKKLVEILGVDISKTIALGDYDNDMEMLRTAGVGIAVANARERVKEVADRITVSNEEHAIAKTIEEIEQGIIGI